jgi:hypothetical protein
VGLFVADHEIVVKLPDLTEVGLAETVTTGAVDIVETETQT